MVNPSNSGWTDCFLFKKKIEDWKTFFFFAVRSPLTTIPLLVVWNVLMSLANQKIKIKIYIEIQQEKGQQKKV